MKVKCIECRELIKDDKWFGNHSYPRCEGCENENLRDYLMIDYDDGYDEEYYDGDEE